MGSSDDLFAYKEAESQFVRGCRLSTSDRDRIKTFVQEFVQSGIGSVCGTPNATSARTGEMSTEDVVAQQVVSGPDVQYWQVRFPPADQQLCGDLF